jgi:hypothetical protein
MAPRLAWIERRTAWGSRFSPVVRHGGDRSRRAHQEPVAWNRCSPRWITAVLRGSASPWLLALVWIHCGCRGAVASHSRGETRRGPEPPSTSGNGGMKSLPFAVDHGRFSAALRLHGSTTGLDRASDGVKVAVHSRGETRRGPEPQSTAGTGGMESLPFAVDDGRFSVALRLCGSTPGSDRTSDGAKVAVRQAALRRSRPSACVCSRRS